MSARLLRHSRAGGNTVFKNFLKVNVGEWIPACAGMTRGLVGGFFIFISTTACVVQHQPPSRGQIKIIEGKTSHSAVEHIRIGLREDIPEANVFCDAPMKMTNLNSGDTTDLAAGSLTIKSRGKSLLVNGRDVGEKIRITSTDAGAYLKMGEKAFRGDFIMLGVFDGRLTVIDELGIDDYLKGVLPREASVSWPQESLKVQAVASRTYLAAHLGKHKSEGFDLCSDVHCQVYGGMTKEHPKTSTAVDDTKGEILTYKDKPIGAFFHSNCGGSTEEIGPVWGSDNKPYLPRKKCGYGTADPRYHWTLALHDNDILSALKNKGLIKGSDLKSVTVTKKSGTGRAETVQIKTDAGAYSMRGNDFRIALNPEKIRSTLWTNLRKQNNIYYFEGRGWGHGVGMCQWGAKGQAEQGRHYREILQFYYPHTDLVQWSR